MDSERWRRVSELFDCALERPAPERSGFLGDACAGDPELRREVESLLAAHDRDPEYLEGPTDLLLDAALAAGELPRAEDPFVGRRVGDWVLRQRIGSGATGVVYRAEQAQDARTVAAVKLIAGSARARDSAERSRASRSRLTTLAHPHLARWLDAGVTADGVAYFVTEYVDGSSIVRHCADHALAVRQRLTLVATACSAVEVLHRHQVVHGALAPGNLLVSADGGVMVVDLGVASVVGEPSGAPLPPGDDAGEPLAITEYTSPEQERGAVVTPASDVYALGVLLYELLAEKRPFVFATRSRAEIGRILNQAPVIRPSDAQPARRHELAGALDAIVLRAMQRDPARRPASAAALADQLRGTFEGASTSGGPAGRAAPTRRLARRQGWRSRANAVMALALLGSAAVAWVSWRTPHRRDAPQEHTHQDPSAAWSELLRLAGIPPEDSAADRGALLEAAERNADTLAAQPDRQARLWQLLAEAREARGEAPHASALLRKVLAYQRATLDPDAPALASTLRELERLEHVGSAPARR